MILLIIIIAFWYVTPSRNIIHFYSEKSSSDEVPIGLPKIHLAACNWNFIITEFISSE